MVALLITLAACENTAQNTAIKNEEQINVKEIVFIDLKDFESKAADFVGKQVKLTGTIDHVCKHGGKKMFIVSEDSESRVKIVTGENMAAFNTELEGESLAVIGTVDELRIDEDYLREWEEEIKDNKGQTEEKEGMHAGEKKGEKQIGDGEHHEEDISEEMKQIENLRQQLIDSGKDHLSFYSVVCDEYEVVNTDEEEGV